MHILLFWNFEFYTGMTKLVHHDKATITAMKVLARHLAIVITSLVCAQLIEPTDTHRDDTNDVIDGISTVLTHVGEFTGGQLVVEVDASLSQALRLPPTTLVIINVA